MSCGLSARLYDLDDDKVELAPSALLGFVMVTSEKAPITGPGGGLVGDTIKFCRDLTIVHPLGPCLSFLQAKGSFGTTVVVILVDVEDFLVRARQSSSTDASVRSRLPAARESESIQSKQRLLQASADDQHIPFGVVESVHGVRAEK
jgi:hypothetical protein